MKSNCFFFRLDLFLFLTCFFISNAQIFPIKPFYYKKLEGTIGKKEVFVILYYNNEYMQGSYIKGYYIENNQIKKDLYLIDISSDHTQMVFKEYFPSISLTPKTQHLVQRSNIKLIYDKKLKLYKGYRSDSSNKSEKIILKEIETKNSIKFDYEYLSNTVEKEKKPPLGHNLEFHFVGIQFLEKNEKSDWLAKELKKLAGFDMNKNWKSSFENFVKENVKKEQNYFSKNLYDKSVRKPEAYVSHKFFSVLYNEYDFLALSYENYKAFKGTYISGQVAHHFFDLKNKKKLSLLHPNDIFVSNPDIHLMKEDGIKFLSLKKDSEIYKIFAHYLKIYDFFFQKGNPIYIYENFYLNQKGIVFFINSFSPIYRKTEVFIPYETIKKYLRP